METGMSDQNFYKVLEVSRTASADEIKRAYRKMARKHHPDVHAGDDKKFKAINNAYSVLSDPETRAAYDKYGADWENPPPPEREGGYGFASEDMGRADASAFRDFFESAFGDRHAGQDPRFAQAAAQQARLEVDLEDVFNGARKTVALRMPELDSQGQVTWRDQRIDVNIPKGVVAGQHIVLKGQGSKGGDLLIEIAIKPHPTFQIDGHNISTDLPVTPWEAALGARIPMPTPGGKVQIKVPPNARSGQRLRLKGRGLPGRIPGDLFAKLLIVNPPVETAEARALYEKMAKELRFDPREAKGG
jgi:curved DNA-binding protein